MMKHGNKWALVILAAVIVPFACAPMDRQMLEPEIGLDPSTGKRLILAMIKPNSPSGGASHLGRDSQSKRPASSSPNP